MLQVFGSPDEILHGFYVEKLMDIVVVSQEVRRDLSRGSELSVLSDYGLDFFDKGVFGVVAVTPRYWVVCIGSFLAAANWMTQEEIVTARFGAV